MHVLLLHQWRVHLGVSLIYNFLHGYLCGRRHKAAMIAELNLKIQLTISSTQSVCGMEISMEYTDECAQAFLDNQEKLFSEPVAENIDDAKEFLEECFAQVFDNIDDVRQYLEEEGMDVDGMSDDEIEDALEVFKYEDGYLVVVA